MSDTGRRTFGRSPCVVRGVRHTMLPSTDTALLGSVTVLLVGGIVIASAAPALSTAPTAADGNDLQEAQEDDDTSWNARVSSDEIIWQNQRAYFDGTEVVNNASIEPVSRASEESRTFEIRTVEDGAIGTSVDEFQVNENGVGVIDTTGYEPGEYVVVYEDMPIAVDDGVGEFTTDVTDASFGVAVQNLTVEFDPDQVDDDEATDLEIDSNRDEGYLISITAAGLHQAQVTRIMENGDPFENSSVRNGTLMRVDDDLEVRPYDGLIDPGQYEFRVTALGAGVSDTAMLTVGDSEQINETMGNDSDGIGAAPGNETGAPGDTDDMFTDTPGNETELPSDGTPTESDPAGNESTATDDGDDTQTETTTETGPGFGLLVAAIGLLGAGLLARRRTH